MLSCYDMKRVLILPANDRLFEININRVQFIFVSRTKFSSEFLQFHNFSYPLEMISNNHSIVDVQYLSINRDTKHPRNHSNSPSLPDSNHLSHFLPTKIPHVPINQAGHSSNPESRFLPFQLGS